MVTGEDGKLLPCYSHVVTVTKHVEHEEKSGCVKRQTFNAFMIAKYTALLYVMISSSTYFHMFSKQRPIIGL